MIVFAQNTALGYSWKTTSWMELLIIFPWLQQFVWGKAFTQCWSQCDQHPTAFHTEHTIRHLQVKWWVLRQCPEKLQAYSHEVTAPRNNCLRRTSKKNAQSFSDFRNVSFKRHSNRLWSIPWEMRKKSKPPPHQVWQQERATQETVWAKNKK